MDNVDRLRNKVALFAAMFWALGIVLASHHSSAVHKASPYGHSWLNSQQRPVDNPPPFSYLGMLFIYGDTRLDFNEV